MTKYYYTEELDQAIQDITDDLTIGDMWECLSSMDDGHLGDILCDYQEKYAMNNSIGGTILNCIDNYVLDLANKKCIADKEKDEMPSM